MGIISKLDQNDFDKDIKALFMKQAVVWQNIITVVFQVKLVRKPFWDGLLITKPNTTFVYNPE